MVKKKKKSGSTETVKHDPYFRIKIKLWKCKFEMKMKDL